MCDCYNHKCAECDETIPMHLGGYATGRDEIEVYCGKHIPKNLNNGTLWEWSDDRCDKDSEVEIWRRCFVKWLTENAKNEDYDNEPNTWHCRRV